MLVLTRKLQEAIKIGDEITLTILKVKGNTVRLGIEAPRNVRILRSELPPDDVAEGDATEATASERMIVAEAVVELTATDGDAADVSEDAPAVRPRPLAAKESRGLQGRVRRPRLALATVASEDQATAK